LRLEDQMRVKVRNSQETIRDLEVEGGTVFVEPGEDVTVTMTAEQVEAAEATGWFVIADVREEDV
jgi:hypothetical protein